MIYLDNAATTRARGTGCNDAVSAGELWERWNYL